MTSINAALHAYNFFTPQIATIANVPFVCMPDGPFLEPETGDPEKAQFVRRFAVQQSPVSRGDFYHFAQTAQDQIFLFDATTRCVVASDPSPTVAIFKGLKQAMDDYLREAHPTARAMLLRGGQKSDALGEVLRNTFQNVQAGVEQHLQPHLMELLAGYLPVYLGGFILFRMRSSSPPDVQERESPMLGLALREAAAYAAFHGLRLPTDEERQYLLRHARAQVCSVPNGGGEWVSNPPRHIDPYELLHTGFRCVAPEDPLEALNLLPFAFAKNHLPPKAKLGSLFPGLWTFLNTGDSSPIIIGRLDQFEAALTLARQFGISENEIPFWNPVRERS